MLPTTLVRVLGTGDSEDSFVGEHCKDWGSLGKDLSKLMKTEVWYYQSLPVKEGWTQTRDGVLKLPETG